MSDVDVVDDNAGNRIAGGTAEAALEYVAKSIVDDPESVVVEVSETGGQTVLRLYVASGDKGKIIGKRGRVAMSLCNLEREVGALEGATIVVHFAAE